jgi:hypothetical protein
MLPWNAILTRTMTQRTVRLISASIGLLFIAAGGICAGQLAHFRRQGAADMQRALGVLARDAAALYSRGADAEEIRAAAERAFAEQPGLAALTVRLDGRLAYATSVSPRFLAPDTDNTQTVRTFSPLLHKAASVAFTTERGQSGVLTIAFYVLQPDDLFRALSVSFVLIFAATFAAFVLLYYLTKYRSSEPQSESPAAAPSPPDVPAETVAESIDGTDAGFEFAGETRFLESLADSLADAEARDAELSLAVADIAPADSAAARGVLRDKGTAFALESGTFAFILQGADTEQALAEAKELYMALDGALADSAEADIRIGISSRFSRAVGAAQLLSEAEEAVRQARADADTPIVALKTGKPPPDGAQAESPSP